MATMRSPSCGEHNSIDLTWLAQAIINTESDNEVRQLASVVLAGDKAAQLIMLDWVQEHRDWLERNVSMISPFKVGECVLIKTVTLYYVGRVKEVGLGWIQLEDASWIHWTARLGSLMATYDLTMEHGGRHPRTERVGTVFLWTQSFVAHYPWHGELPAHSLPA